MESTEVPDRSVIVALVIAQLQEVLALKESPAAHSVNASTVLIGDQAVFDSLDLVTLIVDLEQRVADQYEIAVTLADDRAMSQKHSPFRTPQSLGDYIHMLLEEGQNDGA